MPGLQDVKQRFSNSISMKLLVIAFLILILQIPMSYVSNLIYERQSMQSQAQNDISQRWGGSQHIGAPMVSVIYKKLKIVKDKNGDDKPVTYQYQDHILASTFNVTVDLDAHKRYLGIYEVPVYNTKVHLNGTIEINPKLHLGAHDSWSIHQIFLPINEMRGLKSIDKILINGEQQPLSPQQNQFEGLNGLNIEIANLKQHKLLNYQIDLTLSGSTQFDIIPLAGQSNISITSNWPSPSFTGDFLPAQRKIGDKGFTAQWQVNELNHNFGRVLKGNKNYSLVSSKPTLGVKIIIPANIYQVNERTVKYGLLIMLLTFAGFFLAEMFFKLRLHPFQYILIGFSLCVFYLLLLSISEYLHFGWSFLLASTSIILLITGYCSVVLHNKKRGIYTGILFAILYGFIYVLVKAEQLSLLMGAIGIWFFLSAVMYLTRKIDWYQINSNKD